MVIVFNDEEKKFIKDTAEEYNTTLKSLVKTYVEIMESNFEQDIKDTAKELE